jgi:RNA polymerase sigma-70 factor (ECF subfamily)
MRASQSVSTWSWDRLLASGTAAAAPAVREDPDREWVLRARKGDAAAFRVLVDRYRHQALEVALRIVRSPEAAEETAQDAFIRAWKALDGFRHEARFSTWLYRIVTRCALDAVRRARTRDRRETGIAPEALAAIPDPARAPEGLRRRRLERILGELAPVPRAVVTLFYLRDLTVEEIAGILDLPQGTVKTHLHRSRAALRSAWRRHEASDDLR